MVSCVKHALTVLIFVNTSVLYAQSPKQIDVEAVRTDLLSKGHIVPEDVIRKAKATDFRIMYTSNMCFVLLPFKTSSNDPSMRSSDLMAYRYSDDQWTFENLLPSWFNIELLDLTQAVFLADVKNCDDNGSCQTYKAVVHYDGKQLFVLRDYRGYDKTLYYKGLKVGDKISDLYTLTDFRVEQHQTSFTLKHKVEVIAAISKNVIKKPLADTFERVIANH